MFFFLGMEGGAPYCPLLFADITVKVLPFPRGMMLFCSFLSPYLTLSLSPSLTHSRFPPSHPAKRATTKNRILLVIPVWRSPFLPFSHHIRAIIAEIGRYFCPFCSSSNALRARITDSSSRRAIGHAYRGMYARRSFPFLNKQYAVLLLLLSKYFCLIQ